MPRRAGSSSTKRRECEAKMRRSSPRRRGKDHSQRYTMLILLGGPLPIECSGHVCIGAAVGK
eukprot:4901957-Pleurochrysis_carterae.AAC.6